MMLKNPSTRDHILWGCVQHSPRAVGSVANVLLCMAPSVEKIGKNSSKYLISMPAGRAYCIKRKCSATPGRGQEEE